MANDFIRLNKLIASRGICSRRKADELVQAGKVRINGELITNLGSRFPSDAQIEIDGENHAKQNTPIYLLMYKPVQVICSLRDPQGRKTVFDLLPPRYKALRPYPVGRLDYFSEGLLILTNDGDFAHEVMHPAHEHHKEYEVLIRGEVADAAIQDMQNGLQLKDGTACLPVKIRQKRTKNGNTLLIMELRQGLNRQIRKMCEKWQLTILKLKRIRIGNYTLDNLKPGEIRQIKRTDQRD